MCAVPVFIFMSLYIVNCWFVAFGEKKKKECTWICVKNIISIEKWLFSVPSSNQPGHKSWLSQNNLFTSKKKNQALDIQTGRRVSLFFSTSLLARHQRKEKKKTQNLIFLFPRSCQEPGLMYKSNWHLSTISYCKYWN